MLGEFATLVDPQRDIPPQIVRLTGITTAMVCDAPTIGAVLPMFFDFARGAVLVPTMPASTWRSCVPPPSAYTSPGRGRRCCARWAGAPVLSREEAPSVQLAALARLFAVASQPTHRALADARATVEVLHALLERVGNQGVHTYADLRAYLPGLTPAQRSKRTLAEDLPHRPGVYLFRAPSGEVLYVGTAIDLRRRVIQYFNGADRRARTRELVALAAASTMSSARTRWKPACVSCGCWPRMPALQPPLTVPAPLVVGGIDRRGVPAAVGGAGPATTARWPVSVPRRRRRHRRPAGTVHRDPHLHPPPRALRAARTGLPAA
ncbi:exonuclease family protein [Mycobacterium xenopi 4042]|uniref:Exonuclease family protein n=1 Tax=Mycobacterium xenopi 4042 TaxID=1299334 RepID=X7ZWE8_MYCXE|nr:exonuclease family protein [Mycobacterium xenopi 4042]